MRWMHAGCAGLGAVASIVLLGSNVASAGSLGFPTEQALVPVAVGAAFALPALMALAYTLLCRLGRALGPLVGVSVLALATVAVVGYWQPGLLPLPWS